MILASTGTDALQVGLALGLIFSFMAFALARIFTSNSVIAAGRAARAAEATLAEIQAAREDLGGTRLPLAAPPPARARRRRRARIVLMTADEWKALSPEERAEKVLTVLPLHADDENGLTGKSVAHQLGLATAQQVTAALTRLRKDGRATSRWDKRYGHRVYWSATPK